MPIKDEEEQRIASREAMKRLRERRKLEAETTNRKFEETIPDDPENLNFNMKPNPEKPLSLEEYLAEKPEATMTEYIKYKIAWSYSHNWKAEKEEQDKLKNRNEREKFNTSNHECLIWRRQFSKGQKSDFRYNHLGSCLDCCSWYAKQRNRNAFDLNDTGKNSEGFEELKGYADFMKPDKPFPEDFILHPSGAVFPMNRTCSNCGTPLNEKGKCSVCEPD